MTEHSCHPPADKTDFLLWGSLISIVILYTHFALFESTTQFTAWYATLSASVFDLVNTMWRGGNLGILMK